MENRDLRLLINYDFHCDLSATECHRRLTSAYPSISVSYETVRAWYRRFREGDEGLSDHERCGRPKTAVTDENVAKVKDLIESNPRISYDSLQYELGIGRLSLETILHQRLGVKKVTAKFVPHVLTDAQKTARIEWCQTMLSIFKNGTSTMVWDIVTGDETWVRQRDARSIVGRQVWCYEDEEPVPEVRPSSWVGKQMVATFFTKGGHLVTVAVEHHRTVTAKWYTEVCLTAVLNAWQERRPRDGFRHLRLHHDNAPAHSAILTTEFLFEKGVRTVSHPPYSPDLSPADFFLFGIVKEKLRGREFSSAQEAVVAYEDEINSIPRGLWNRAFDNWFKRMSSCVNEHGNYVDK